MCYEPKIAPNRLSLPSLPMYFHPLLLFLFLTGIQDISKRSDLPKVLMKVEEKFRLDLSDEQAEQFFLGLINESLYSLAPRLMEVAHKFAVAMR